MSHHFFKGNMLQKPKIGRRKHAFLADFPLNRSNTTGYHLVGCRKWMGWTSTIYFADFPIEASIDGGIFHIWHQKVFWGFRIWFFNLGECFWVQDCRFMASFSMGFWQQIPSFAGWYSDIPVITGSCHDFLEDFLVVAHKRTGDKHRKFRRFDRFDHVL